MILGRNSTRSSTYPVSGRIGWATSGPTRRNKIRRSSKRSFAAWYRQISDICLVLSPVRIARTMNAKTMGDAEKYYPSQMKNSKLMDIPNAEENRSGLEEITRFFRQAPKWDSESGKQERE